MSHSFGIFPEFDFERLMQLQSMVAISDRNQAHRSFYQHYDTNIEKLQTVRDIISGTHQVNSDIATQWIESQANPPRHRAAQTLINNLHYITMSEVFESVRNLVTQIIGNSPILNLYAGSPHGSHYFMAVLTVYYLRLLDQPDPHIIGELDETSLEPIANQSLVFIDDMAYTGIQIGRISDVLTRNGLLRNPIVKYNITMTVGLVAASSQAVDSISQRRISLYVDRVIPSLKTVAGKRHFLELLFYFSPTTEGNTQVAIYFDHKIADELSTFLRTLMYGPVIPCNLGYEPILDHDIYTLLNGLVDHVVWHPESGNPTEEEQQREDDSINIYDLELESYQPMMWNIIEADKLCDREISHVFFLPFIAGCIDSHPPHQDFFQRESYFMFIADTSYNKAYAQFIDELTDPIHRCISSFYKDGPFKMQ